MVATNRWPRGSAWRGCWTVVVEPARHNLVLDGYVDVDVSNAGCIHLQRTLFIAIAPGERRARPPRGLDRPGYKLDVVHPNIVAELFCSPLEPAVHVGVKVGNDVTSGGDRLSHAGLVKNEKGTRILLALERNTPARRYEVCHRTGGMK